MTHYIGTIYFLGKYRPLSVEGDNLEEIMIDLAIRANQAPPEAQERVMSLWASLDTRATSQSVEHGYYGASWLETDRHPLDSELWERVWQSMPPCPGLIYN
jgi:hypothetical protein